ncbi:MAG TPA: ATP-binding cassette domain-containing protein [Ktedonobacteraceae bacterium]|nr:ATP-binding cassette domain-containing protein [Ktedonobacteraceae bacterium]
MHSPNVAITVRNLCKHYVVPERETGILPALRNLVQRRTRTVVAVENVSFDLAPGEIVGFLGPNGAGKTTTLKVLSGLLHPTAGEVSVLGHVPWRREKALLQQITLVMGQRSQLWWDLPACDSFELNRVIYRVPLHTYHHTLKRLIELLELTPLLHKPVRTLSLGERMKCELALALLHQPHILFLDEPTLGLDVTMQRRIRTFIREYNRRYEATVLLTSHYMADVEALCRRLLILHSGTLLFDGNTTELVQRFAPHQTVEDAIAEVFAGGAL